MKLSITYRIVICATLVLAGSLLLLTFLIAIPFQKRILTQRMADMAKIVFQTSAPAISQALEFNDDLAIISQIENLLKIQDISKVYIVDRFGKVLFHDKLNEWGKIYTDSISKSIALTKKEIFQETPEGYLFAGPLVSSATLCVEFSSENVHRILSTTTRSIVLAVALLTMLGAIAIILIVAPTVKIGVKSVEARNEYARKNQIQKDITKESSQYDTTLKQFLQALCPYLSQGIVITNSENRVICVNKQAADYFHIPPPTPEGLHLLDIVKSEEAGHLLRMSFAQIGTEVSGHVNNMLLRIITLPSTSGKAAGTLIILETIAHEG